MDKVERFLREYWFARRSIGRLMLDLSTAKAVLEQCCARMPGTRLAEAEPYSGTPESPAEHAAWVIVGQHRAEVNAIEQRLTEERDMLSRIETAMKDAALDARECEYVRLRYFENRSMEAVCQRLFCSPATGGRIREAVIKKMTPLAG